MPVITTQEKDKSETFTRMTYKPDVSDIKKHCHYKNKSEVVLNFADTNKKKIIKTTIFFLQVGDFNITVIVYKRKAYIVRRFEHYEEQCTWEVILNENNITNINKEEVK
jgi:hypothetical protein